MLKRETRAFYSHHVRRVRAHRSCRFASSTRARHERMSPAAIAGAWRYRTTTAKQKRVQSTVEM